MKEETLKKCQSVDKLVDQNWNIKDAVTKVGIGLGTYYRYMKSDKSDVKAEEPKALRPLHITEGPMPEGLLGRLLESNLPKRDKVYAVSLLIRDEF